MVAWEQHGQKGFKRGEADKGAKYNGKEIIRPQRQRQTVRNSSSLCFTESPHAVTLAFPSLCAISTDVKFGLLFRCQNVYLCPGFCHLLTDALGQASSYLPHFFSCVE